MTERKTKSASKTYFHLSVSIKEQEFLKKQIAHSTWTPRRGFSVLQVRICVVSIYTNTSSLSGSMASSSPASTPENSRKCVGL